MRCERLPKPGDVHLQAVRRRRRRAVAPDLVDQALAGNDLISTEQQSCKNGALLAAAELDRAIADLGLERTEDAKPY